MRSYEKRIQDVMVYICSTYPDIKWLTKARMTMLIYLCDWRMSQKNNRTIVTERWGFNHFGPVIEDLLKIAIDSKVLSFNTSKGTYDVIMQTILLKEEGVNPHELNEEEMLIINEILEETKDLNISDLSSLVLSTYPIVEQSKHSIIDLVELAKLERAEHQVDNIVKEISIQMANKWLLKHAHLLKSIRFELSLLANNFDLGRVESVNVCNMDKELTIEIFVKSTAEEVFNVNEKHREEWYKMHGELDSSYLSLIAI